MATPTYELIETETLSSSASSVTFASVPQGFRDLVLVIDKLGTSLIGTEIQFNSDTGSNYVYMNFSGDGNAISSGDGTETSVRPGGNATATVRKQVICQIMDYSATDKHKSVLVRSNVETAETRFYYTRWANTNAITNIYIDPIINQFAAGSVFSLYGIAS